MAVKTFDLIVIGGGSGGVATANRAASYGARVALLEPDRLGGTCVNRGCIPKKLSWLAARSAQDLVNAQDYGFAPVEVEHDFGALRRARDRYIEFLNGRYAERLDRNGVTVIAERASFLDPHTIAVGTRHLHARKFLIATGAHPRSLEVPGGEFALNSDDFFKLDRRPLRVAMIGAGYIAAELGGVLAELGTHVDMFLGGREPLAHFDPFIRKTFTETLEDSGVRCHKATVASLSHHGDGYTVTITHGEAFHGYDVVIAAIGRFPHTAGLGLEAAGVATDASGAIAIDRYQTTSVPHIFAVGDVTGRAHALTPVAIAAGRRLADRLFGGWEGRHLDYEFVPTVVFSHPPVGSVGLTEPEARDRFGERVRVHTRRFTPLGSALPRIKEPAAMKLVTLLPAERIIGLHVIGEGADELLQGFAVALRMGATKRDFDETVAIHPTSAEELVTMY